MPEYVVKPCVVEAWPWPWSGLDHPKVMIRDNGEGSPCATVICGSTRIHAPKGSWIIRHADGHFEVLTDDDFNSQYEAR